VPGSTTKFVAITGITWLALSGLSLHAMQRRCGTEDIETTNGYVKMAEDLSGTIGEPFPELPRSLLPLSKQCLSAHDQAENECRRRESAGNRRLYSHLCDIE
jgi:hypothetical protein